jgi:hypothetical protein
MTDGWVGVDLDGTLAKYDGWQGVRHIGDPIEPMVARVKQWRAAGWDVRIFTARVAGRAPDIAAIEAIEEWCREHLGEILPITNEKDFGMIECWDDRSICVERNTGLILGINEDRNGPLPLLSWR